MGISFSLCFWFVKLLRFCFGPCCILLMVVHVACMHTKFHLENMKGKEHLRLMYSWETHTRMNHREMGPEGVDLIELA